MKLLLASVPLLLFTTNKHAFAVENLDCDNTQASHRACTQIADGGARCGTPQAFTAGCADVTPAENSALAEECRVAGGCFGNTRSGLWYTYTENGSTYRCRCGCFSEETMIRGENGDFEIKSLINMERFPLLLASAGLDSSALTPVSIKDVVFGPEKELMHEITTALGKTVMITNKHPVAIADKEGKLSKMITADQVKVGDFMIDEFGNQELVLSNASKQYSGRVVNFDVVSNNPTDHIVIANGLKMGDNVWQQRLAKSEGRLLDRDDIIREILAAKKIK